MRDFHTITSTTGLLDVGEVERFGLPIAALLAQLRSVIENLSDAQYAQKPVGVVESSIGGHVRHCLDHVRALLSAVNTGVLDYDHRQRGTAVELCRQAAMDEARRLMDELSQLPGDAPARLVRMSVLMSADAPPLRVYSTIGREMAYTLSHTIHHNALIAAMVRTLGGWLPERFGYAPSTPISGQLGNSGGPAAATL